MKMRKVETKLRIEFHVRCDNLVTRYQFFMMKQDSGEDYSSMHICMMAKQKDANIKHIITDKVVCQVMLTSCKDDKLLQKMMGK